MVQNLQDIQEDAIYLPEASRVIRTCWELKLDGSYDKRCIFFLQKSSHCKPTTWKGGNQRQKYPNLSLTPSPPLQLVPPIG